MYNTFKLRIASSLLVGCNQNYTNVYGGPVKCIDMISELNKDTALALENLTGSLGNNYKTLKLESYLTKEE